MGSARRFGCRDLTREEDIGVGWGAGDGLDKAVGLDFVPPRVSACTAQLELARG